MKMFEYGSGVIAAKRAKPGDDLASRLLAAEVTAAGWTTWSSCCSSCCGGRRRRHHAQPAFRRAAGPDGEPDQYAWLMEDLPGRLRRPAKSCCAM